MGEWTSTIWTLVRWVWNVDEDAVKGFAEEVQENLAVDEVEGLSVIFSKTKNLLEIESEGATFLQEQEETNDGWEMVGMVLQLYYL